MSDLIASAWSGMSKMASGLWIKVGGALVAIAVVVSIYASIRRSGRDSQRAEDLAVTNQRQKDIQDADARGPRGHSDVLDRLRDHSF